jgi:predicted CopG family antitoxin
MKKERDSTRDIERRRLRRKKKLVDVFNIVLSAHVRTRTRSRKEIKENVYGTQMSESQPLSPDSYTISLSLSNRIVVYYNNNFFSSTGNFFLGGEMFLVGGVEKFIKRRMSIYLFKISFSAFPRDR